MLDYQQLHEEINDVCMKNAMADHIVNFSDRVTCCHIDGHTTSVEPLKPDIGDDIEELTAGYDKWLRRKKVKQHWQDFVENVTCHGFHYLFDNDYRVRKLIWFLLVVGSVGFLFQKLHESTSKYFAYPFSTTTTITYEDSMEFPAISICNLNDFRNSKMKGTKLDHLLTRLAANLETRDSMAQKLGPDDYRNTTTEAVHLMHDMLWGCSILGVPCGFWNFTRFYQTQGEHCYTYIPTARVKETGAKNGITLTFNIEHYDYYRQIEEAGLRLVIHKKDETPVRMQGIGLPPGYTTFVQIEKRKTINLKSPYATNCGSRPLKYFEHYSEHACWVESLTDHVVEKCKCKDSFMPGNHRACSLSELFNCTWPEWEHFKTLKNTNCPLACEIYTFTPLLSYAKFPSNKMADRLAESLNLSGSPLENRMFIRDNFLRVILFYEQLTYVQMKQEPSYDLMVLLGDIGGQLGLFLGTSLLTYVEFFDYLAMVIYTKYFEIFKPRRAEQ